jgi:hypothetical protein
VRQPNLACSPISPLLHLAVSRVDRSSPFR